MTKQTDHLTNLGDTTATGEAMASLLGCSLSYLGRLVKEGHVDRPSKGKYSVGSVGKYITHLKGQRKPATQVKEDIDVAKLEGLKLDNAKRKLDLSTTIDAIRKDARNEFALLLHYLFVDIRRQVQLLERSDVKRLQDALDDTLRAIKKTLKTGGIDPIQYLKDIEGNDL